MKDQNICAHGYDKRFVHCNRCADPAFDAAKQPSFTVMTATIGGAQPAADTIAKPQGFPSSKQQGHLNYSHGHWLQRAAEILDEDAAALRQAHTIDGEWPDDEEEVREHWVEMQHAVRAVRIEAERAHETTRDALPQLEWEVTYDVVAYNASWGGYGSNASKSGFLSEEEAIAYAKPLEAHLNAVVWKSTKPKPVTPLAIKVWSAVKTAAGVPQTAIQERPRG